MHSRHSPASMTLNILFGQVSVISLDLEVNFALSHGA